MIKNLMDPKGLSKYLKISIETVCVWTSMKQIPFFKVDRLVRFDMVETDKWMEDKKQKIYENC